MRRELLVSFDTGIYCLFYTCFLWADFPLLLNLLWSYGVNVDPYVRLFVDIAVFCNENMYLPVMIFFLVVLSLEYFTNIFNLAYIKLSLKLFMVIFLILTMVNIPILLMPSGRLI